MQCKYALATKNTKSDGRVVLRKDNTVECVNNTMHSGNHVTFLKI